MDRGTRRHRTYTVIGRRCETPFAPSGREPHRYAKTTPLGCHCRKRAKGRPRVSLGMCCIGSRDRIYHWRQQVRELRNLSRGNWNEWDADVVALLAAPHVKGA